jgi:hypothetical protein
MKKKLIKLVVSLGKGQKEVELNYKNGKWGGIETLIDSLLGPYGMEPIERKKTEDFIQYLLEIDGLKGRKTYTNTQ